jgi:DNA replication protein DnaC
MGLAKLTFIERSENIILIGEPGTGKSGIAMSLLRLALLNGYRGKFYNAQVLLNGNYSRPLSSYFTRKRHLNCN